MITIAIAKGRMQDDALSLLARAGIRAGDILVRMDDADLPTLSALQHELAQERIGRIARLDYIRLGELRHATVTPAEARAA
jgi:S1-C subfamily serine protease